VRDSALFQSYRMVLRISEEKPDAFSKCKGVVRQAHTSDATPSKPVLFRS